MWALLFQLSATMVPPFVEALLGCITDELKSTSRAAALGCGYQCGSKDLNHRKGIQAPCEIGRLYSAVPLEGHLEPLSPPLTLILCSCKFSGALKHDSVRTWCC